MSFGGSVSAMISSLKVNNSLRRKHKSASIFSKKPTVTETEYNPISKEENLAIIQENKEKLRTATIYRNIYGVIMLLIIAPLVIMLFLQFLRWI